MQKLKIALLALGTINLLGLIFTIIHIINPNELHPQSPANTVNNQTSGIIYAIISSAICFGLAYGIHKRLMIGWKLGWLAIIALVVYFVMQVVLKMPHSPGYNDHPVLFTAMVTLGAVTFFSFIIFKWKQQKSYFIGQS